jgi:hypothetical protein
MPELGHPVVGVVAVGSLERVRQLVGEQPGSGPELVDRVGDADLVGVCPHQPPGGALHQPAALDQHRELCLRRDVVVQPLDGLPEGAHAQHLARRRVGAGQNRRRRAGLLAQAEGKRGAAPVDKLVGDHRGDDLPPQAVAPHLRPVALGQRRREVALQVVGEKAVLG